MCTESTTSTRVQPRIRDDKKVTSEPTKSKQTEETMDTTKPPASEDVYEFKTVKESDQAQEQKTDNQETTSETSEIPSVPTTQSEETSKRNFSEIADSNEDTINDEETRRKKRKEETSKDAKTPTQRTANQTKGQGGKQGVTTQGKQTQLGGKTSEKKSPCSSPKPSSNSDAEVEDGKSDLKVPPLKIVIPSGSEQESGTSRNGKNSSQRAHPLPYVVASSNSSDSNDKEMPAGNTSPDSGSKEEKKEGNPGQADDQRGSSHQRVLRSSHRSGPAPGVDRGSNNSSPQLQRSHSPSPSASPATPSIEVTTAAGTVTTQKTTESQAAASNDTETTSVASTSSTSTTTTAPVELHPRKRKMKPSKEMAAPPPEPQETPAEAQIHPHDQPITNCYQLFLNIRKQVGGELSGVGYDFFFISD